MAGFGDWSRGDCAVGAGAEERKAAVSDDTLLWLGLAGLAVLWFIHQVGQAFSVPPTSSTLPPMQTPTPSGAYAQTLGSVLYYQGSDGTIYSAATNQPTVVPAGPAGCPTTANSPLLATQDPAYTPPGIEYSSADWCAWKQGLLAPAAQTAH